PGNLPHGKLVEPEAQWPDGVRTGRGDDFARQRRQWRGEWSKPFAKWTFIVYRRWTMNNSAERLRSLSSAPDCCTPAGLARGLAALAHPARVEILRCLAGA